MREDDAGGGSVAGPNETLTTKKSLKRKSEEGLDLLNTSPRKSSKRTNWRPKKWKKYKKAKSLDNGMTGKSSATKKGRKRRLTASFNAPFNSTQFLMNDHVSEAIRHLDTELNIQHKEEDEDEDEDSNLQRPFRRITRARESSFSVDSDDEYYYSSPEDDAEFMSKEFIKDYDNVRNGRLVDMSKAELINEYLQMEQKIEALEKRLNGKANTNSEGQSVEVDKVEIGEKIKLFQKEIQRLESENDELKRNTVACSSCSSCCSSSSSSDEDDSSSDSGSSNSDDDCNEGRNQDPDINAKSLDKAKTNTEEGQDNDTGYESGQSTIKPVQDLEDMESDVKTSGSPVEESDPCPELISVNCITSTSL